MAWSDAHHENQNKRETVNNCNNKGIAILKSLANYLRRTTWRNTLRSRFSERTRSAHLPRTPHETVATGRRVPTRFFEPPVSTVLIQIYYFFPIRMPLGPSWTRFLFYTFFELKKNNFHEPASAILIGKKPANMSQNGGNGALRSKVWQEMHRSTYFFILLRTSSLMGALFLLKHAHS